MDGGTAVALGTETGESPPARLNRGTPASNPSERRFLPGPASRSRPSQSRAFPELVFSEQSTMTERPNPSASETQLAPSVRAPAWRRRLGLLSGSLLAAGVALAASGCLQRPVVEQEPVTSNVFVTQVPFSKIDAIDLLFVVDNSVSMADKQALLVQAVPQMVERLVTPDCVSSDTGERTASTRDGEGNLTCGGAGFALEFEP